MWRERISGGGCVGRDGFLIKFCMNSKVGIKDYRTKVLSFLFLSLYLYIALN